jgi:alpha-galactosidase
LAATAAAIKSHGLIPGLWFEMETCGEASAAFSLVDHLLQRDGLPITVRSRRFWNLNDPVAVDYLAERVIGLLERCGFSYLKVDYNETIGIGCDGAESLGQGLVRQVEGIYRFFDQIHRRLPDLIIENCSSGGHRLEPSMIGRTAMSSFSDAHELKEIPIIAANLHQLMLPRQSQIWAVLHRADDDHRLVYSLSATFLGRMCLSGEIDNLTDQQWNLVTAAQNLYRIAWPVIKHGTSRRFGTIGPSWRHPTGWQSVVRLGRDGNSALVVTHTFADSPAEFQTPLPTGKPWMITEQFSASRTSMAVQGDQLICRAGQPFSASVVLLSR